jgi:hypothetical protein
LSQIIQEHRLAKSACLDGGDRRPDNGEFPIGRRDSAQEETGMALPPHLAELESRLLGRFEEAFDGYRRALEQRLRGALERLGAELAEVPPPPIDALVSGLGLEAVEELPRREGASEAFAALLETSRAGDRADDQAGVLDALLAGCRRWADRAALVLTREDGLSIWGAVGFGERVPGGEAIAWSEPLRAALHRGSCQRLEADEAAPIAAALGFAPAGSAALVPMVLRDQLAAVVWADRDGSSAAGAPELAALQLLVHLAAQRLELQALSSRAATATLYEAAAAGLAPLPLWTAPPEAAESATASTVAAPEPLSAPDGSAEPATGAEPDAAELWQTEPELERAPSAHPEDEPQAVGDAVDVEFEEVAEEPQTAAPSPESQAEAYEPTPEFDLEEVTEPPVPPVAAPLDALGTVRLVRTDLDAPPREEQTAPLSIAPVPPPPAASPAPAEAAAAAPEPTTEPDLTEDATVLTLRRPEWATPPAPPAAPPAAPAEEATERTASRMRSTEVAPPPDVRGPGLAFANARSARTSEQPLHEEAKRLARLLISEIKLYNEEQVMEGRRNRDLYHRLREDIDRSRQIYDERVDAEVRGDSDYFQQELVRSLAGGDPRALGI